MRCRQCGANVKYSKKNVECIRCGAKIYLLEGKTNIKANTSLGEKIFDFPYLYNLKIRLLNYLNRLQISIDPLIKKKVILDIGCGSYQRRYNPHLAKFRVGIDPSVKALQVGQQLYPDSFHLVASADKLPFKNNSFDVTLLLFTLHHLNNKQWNNAFKEAQRVSREAIIIFDHISNESIVPRNLQKIYWKIFDGGETYPNTLEWKQALRDFKVKKYFRFGSLFKQICFYYLQPKKRNL